MNLYRLVHERHDPIVAGERLTRKSDHSNQKLGPGMYFCLTREAAEAFLRTHAYNYTHLLTCTIGAEVGEFADMREKKVQRDYLRFRSGRSDGDALPEYCAKEGKCGAIYQLSNWVELVFYDDLDVLISESESIETESSQTASSVRSRTARIRRLSN